MVEQGLNYNWHRYYDPTTGRYTQPDPLGFIDGPAIYAYAGNNPVMNVEPRGLFDEGFAAGGHNLGYGDFSGSINLGGPFDYNRLDKDFSPLYPWDFSSRALHFQNLSDVQKSLATDVTNCNLSNFELHMHAGQDYYTHFDKGYGPFWGHLFGGHSPDRDDGAWMRAEGMTQSWIEAWERNCSCLDGHTNVDTTPKLSSR